MSPPRSGGGHADAPIVIGGAGGSGTRLVAGFAQAMGVHIGHCLNHAMDNRWFAVLFKRPDWTAAAAAEADVRAALDLFTRASLYGLRGRARARDIALIDRCLTTWQPGLDDPGLVRRIRQSLLDSDGLAQPLRHPWGWKEPNSHMFIAQIAQHFPNAKYVMVLRNGLDMAFSANRRQARLWGPRFGLALTSGTVTPEQALDYWIAANQRARRLLRTHMPDRSLELRYETLLSDPKAGIAALADLVGTTLPPETAETLAGMVRPPATVGRYRNHDLTALRPDQIDAVRAMGFPVSLP